MRHMATAVRGNPYEAAFQRARIGRHWGFLPSQLGHRSYPAYLREQGMCKRGFTPLPERSVDPDARLRAVRGEPSEVEKEALRSFLWRYGRITGGKRDTYNPRHGEVRRTYAYKTRPCKYRLSFVSWSGRSSPRTRSRNQVYFLPEGFVPEEEQRGLDELATFGARWHQGS